MNTLLLTLALAAPPDRSGVPDPPPIEKRVSEVERKLDALTRKFEAHLAENAARHQAVAEAEKDRPLAWEEARHKAMADGKPLLVWVGGNFCERCVRESAGEFVHFFASSYDNLPSPSIAVIVPVGNELYRAGDVTWWVEGDREFGHLPSARRTIRRWLDRREDARSRAAAQQSFYQGGAVAPPRVPALAPPFRQPVLRGG